MVYKAPKEWSKTFFAKKKTFQTPGKALQSLVRVYLQHKNILALEKIEFKIAKEQKE